MKNYIIIERATIEDLEQEVNARIIDYELSGGPVVMHGAFVRR